MDILKNNNGMSLISVLVGSAIGLTAVAAISQFLLSTIAWQGYIEDRIEAEAHSRLVDMVLMTPENCRATFVEQAQVIPPALNQTIDLDNTAGIIMKAEDGTSKTILAKNQELNPRLTLDKFSLKVSEEISATEKQAQLQLIFKRTGGIQSKSEVMTKVPLFMTLDAGGAIITCSSNPSRLIGGTPPGERFGPGSCSSQTIALGYSSEVYNALTAGELNGTRNIARADLPLTASPPIQVLDLADVAANPTGFHPYGYTDFSMGVRTGETFAMYDTLGMDIPSIEIPDAPNGTRYSITCPGGGDHPGGECMDLMCENGTWVIDQGKYIEAVVGGGGA